MSNTQNSTKGFELESVVISSSKMIEERGIEIVGSVTDIQIFENINTPFCTGEIALIDQFRLVERLNIEGCEYLTITINQTEGKIKNSVVKRFVIDRLIRSRKANEKADLYVFHFTDDIDYLSNLQNVNKCYTGSPKKIIKRIASEFLNIPEDNVRSGFIEEFDTFQQKIKVIVPNLNPIEAMIWIKNRATSIGGTPYFLFSVFNQNKVKENELFFVDLKTMLEQKPFNASKPYLVGYTQSFPSYNDKIQFLPVLDYDEKNNDNLYKSIHQGIVGAKYRFYDTSKATADEMTFDVHLDAFNQLEDTSRDEIIDRSQNVDIEDNNGAPRKIQNYISKNICQISQSGAYDDGTGRYRSYDEEDEGSSHKKKIIGRALRIFGTNSNTISMKVDGRGYMLGDYVSIGTKIRILFIANRPSSDGQVKIDKKKSGDYLICASRHVFSHENYYINFECAKIKQFKDDSILKDFG